LQRKYNVTPFQFDARTVAPASADGGANLPVGEYPAHIVAGEFKAVKDNPNAGLLQLTVEALPGSPFAGSKGAWRLNLYSTSDKAREIANRQMSSLCHVTNTLVLNSVDELFGKPFIVCVGPQEDTKYTQVNGVKFLDGRDPGKPGAVPAQQQQPQQQQPQGFGQPQQQPPGFQQPQGQPAGGFGAPAGFQQPQGQPQGGFAQPQQQPQAPAGGWAPQGQQPQQQPQGQPQQQWAPQQQPQQPQQPAAAGGWGGAQPQQQPQGGQPWTPGR
jgi:hypothetical protein